MRLRIYLLNLTILALFGWTMIEFYGAFMEIKSTMSDPDGFVFSMNVLPLILFLVIAIPAGVVFTRKQRKDNKGWKEALLFPYELKERDEREKELTSNASRNAYISMMIVFPLLTVGMLFQPLVSDYFSAYPILILMLFPVVQITVFYLSIKKKLYE